MLGASIQIKIDKINKDYDIIKADSKKAKRHFLDNKKSEVLIYKK